MSIRDPERAAVSIIVAHVCLLAIVLGGSFLIGEVGHCAQPEPLCTEEWAQNAGRLAPCSGVLAPTKTYADLLGKAAELAGCNESSAKAAETCAAEKAALAEKLAASEKSRLECEAAHVPPPPPKPERHWYQSPGLWFGVGVVVGAGAAVAGVVLAR